MNLMTQIDIVMLSDILLQSSGLKKELGDLFHVRKFRFCEKKCVRLLHLLSYQRLVYTGLQSLIF